MKGLRIRDGTGKCWYGLRVSSAEWEGGRFPDGRHANGREDACLLQCTTETDGKVKREQKKLSEDKTLQKLKRDDPGIPSTRHLGTPCQLVNLSSQGDVNRDHADYDHICFLVMGKGDKESKTNQHSIWQAHQSFDLDSLSFA